LSIRSCRAIGFGSAGPPTASVRGAGGPIVLQVQSGRLSEAVLPFVAQPLADRRAEGYLRWREFVASARGIMPHILVSDDVRLIADAGA
jgi:hypothetical protein